MGTIAGALDRILAILKWPVAITGLVFLPGLVAALVEVVRAIAREPQPCLAFLAGAGICAVAWYLLFRKRTVGNFIVVLEHELTHALFAWLTFHRVIGFRATLRRGGHVRYLGRGNWLISIAPYFAPTLSIVAIAVLNWLPARYLAYGSAGLGATFAYHLLSTWSETHRHQTDLQEVGLVFSAVFLIAANSLVYGLILGFACGVHPLEYLGHVPGPTLELIRRLRS
jgi:hypothetical protein